MIHLAFAAAIVAGVLAVLWLGYWLGSHCGRLSGLAEAQREQRLLVSLDYDRGFHDGWLAFRHRLPMGQGLSALIPAKRMTRKKAETAPRKFH
jgi:hypothetical protein